LRKSTASRNLPAAASASAVESAAEGDTSGGGDCTKGELMGEPRRDWDAPRRYPPSSASSNASHGFTRTPPPQMVRERPAAKPALRRHRRRRVCRAARTLLDVRCVTISK
jgi:hypothetical protein